MPRMTQAEYDAYEVRAHRGVQSPADGVEVESELHLAIVDECRRRGWQALHGSMAHRTHRTEGEPDFVILASGGRHFLVEAKSKTGKVSAEQAAFAAGAKKNGHTVHVVRSIEEFLRVVDVADSPADTERLDHFSRHLESGRNVDCYLSTGGYRYKLGSKYDRVQYQETLRAAIDASRQNK